MYYLILTFTSLLQLFHWRGHGVSEKLNTLSEIVKLASEW